MDFLDIQIIQLLQENARRSLSEISNIVNLSLPAVSERVRKLEDNQYIKQYTTILNLDKFSKNICSFIYVKLLKKGENVNDNFREYVCKEQDIVECYCITGEYEYLLKIHTKTTIELEKLLAHIRDMSAKTSSLITLSTIKQHYSIAPEL